MIRSAFSQQTPYLAAIKSSREIEKEDIVPADCVGFLVSDGAIELIAKNDQNLYAAMQNKKARLVGYFPQHPFMARFAMDKVLTGDGDLIDVRVELRVVVEDPREFVEKVLFEERVIDKHDYYLKPKVFSDEVAHFVRLYEAADLSSGKLNAAMNDFLKENLSQNLRPLGLRLLDVKTISVWLSSEQDTVMGKIASKLGSFDTPDAFKIFLKEEALDEKMTLHATPDPESDETRDWFETIKSFFSNKESGRNYRMQKIIKSTEENVKKPPARRIRRWWLTAALSILVALAVAITTTLRLFKNGWEASIWKITLLLIVWTISLVTVYFAIRKLSRRLKKSKVSKDGKEQQASPMLTVSRFSQEDRMSMNRRVRQQVASEFEKQKEILERVRGKAYRDGKEALALEAHRMQKELDENIGRILNPNYAAPVYLQEESNFSKETWEKLIESEETLLIKAALLNQEMESFERESNEPNKETASLSEYEASVKQFMNDFNARKGFV
ncbi:MAG: hypothetical protein GX853_03120 [Chloroflexi bacterium]|nr:hypothetical protein [Chloroflexota bacterium]